MACIVKGCKNYRRLMKTADVIFHLFPKNELQEKWLQAIGINTLNWVWSKNKLVCSEHFLDDDYNIIAGRKLLKTNSIPSRNLTEETTVASTSKSNLAEVTNISTSILSTTLSSSSPSLLAEDKLPKEKRKRKKSSWKNVPSGSTSSSGSTAKRRKIQMIKEIHSYSISPRKVKLQNELLKKKHKMFRKKLYVRNKQVKSLKKQVNHLKVVTDFLKTNRNISNTAVEHLEKTYDSVPYLLMKRYLKNITNTTVSHESYPPLLRQFAATLQFYSNKAYEEVRSQFQLALPHPATIRKWYQNVDCQPGFISIAFEALKSKVEESLNQGKELICSLMLDEISIKKQIDFDGKQMWGYVDIGVPIDNDELQPATEVLVLMVVSHRSHWKLPFAYFFIKSLSGKEKANIINEALIRLNEVGVVISSLTSDGPASNFSMMTSLGCNFNDINNMQTWFPHPSDVEQKVFCVMDQCHMIKLMRNNFATLQQFKDPDGKIIHWSFIQKLYDIQTTEGLLIANKLKRAHMEWYKQKMKVNLAAQTLSKSISDAIEFLDVKLGVLEFQGSKSTVEFIRRMDTLFDILNSRSPQAKGYKGPLRESNEHIWSPFLKESINYLLHCTDVGGRPLWSTPKKTPFIGFAITSLSIIGIYETFVKKGQMNYFLTYKVSQDHLETFFCSIRSRNGWNNNPTCLQFMRTFRRLLLHTKLAPRGGNCKVSDTTTILHVTSTNKD